MLTQSKGWLAISTDGFAAMNAARPPEHLVKELVQNALDSIAEGEPGQINLNYGYHQGQFYIECRDNGSGIECLSDLRVVYLTHKTDSHLKRGRFGRGFKEALCVADYALVQSKGQQIEFLYDGQERVTQENPSGTFRSGTLVKMQMAWPPETKLKLDHYFRQFLIPEGIQFRLNGIPLVTRPSQYRVATPLTTEVYDYQAQSWKNPRRKTSIHLIPSQADEIPMIYEMGIPVAPVEWTVPFHCNIQQRVPMNPNRDAVATGYPLKLHVACLPILLESMDSETVRQDWVGNAGKKCDQAVKQQIITKAFGGNIARSVPKTGARQFDEDARELGVEIVKTSQTSGGFREMLKELVPTAREVVQKDEVQKAAEATASGFAPTQPLLEQDPRQMWIERQGGIDHVNRCLDFAVWFCQQLLDSYPFPLRRVTGKVAVNPEGRQRFVAHWSSENVLTLALDHDELWRNPLGPESLEVFIHEAAHAMNMHHGEDFRREVERLAGVAAYVMLKEYSWIVSKYYYLLQ